MDRMTDLLTVYEDDEANSFIDCQEILSNLLNFGILVQPVLMIVMYWPIITVFVNRPPRTGMKVKDSQQNHSSHQKKCTLRNTKIHQVQFRKILLKMKKKQNIGLLPSHAPLPEWTCIKQYLRYLDLDEPIIGLSCLTQVPDHPNEEGKRVLKYKCTMCIVEMELCSIVAHIIGRKHRQKYLELKRPDLVTWSDTDTQKQAGLIARAKAAVVEKQEGWGTPKELKKPRSLPISKVQNKPYNAKDFAEERRTGGKRLRDEPVDSRRMDYPNAVPRNRFNDRDLRDHVAEQYESSRIGTYEDRRSTMPPGPTHGGTFHDESRRGAVRETYNEHWDEAYQMQRYPHDPRAYMQQDGLVKKSRFSDATAQEVAVAQNSYSNKTDHRRPPPARGMQPILMQAPQPSHIPKQGNTFSNPASGSLIKSTDNVLDIIKNIQIQSVSDAMLLKEKLCTVLKEFEAEKSEQSVGYSAQSGGDRKGLNLTDPRRDSRQGVESMYLQKQRYQEPRQFQDDRRGFHEPGQKQADPRGVSDSRKNEADPWGFQEPRRYEGDHGGFQAPRNFNADPRGFPDNRQYEEDPRQYGDESRGYQELPQYEGDHGGFQDPRQFEADPRGFSDNRPYEEDSRGFPEPRQYGQDSGQYVEFQEGVQGMADTRGARNYEDYPDNIQESRPYSNDARGFQENQPHYPETRGFDDHGFAEYPPEDPMGHQDSAFYKEQDKDFRNPDFGRNWEHHKGHHQEGFGRPHAHLESLAPRGRGRNPRNAQGRGPQRHSLKDRRAEQELYDPFQPSGSPPPDARGSTRLDKFASTILELERGLGVAEDGIVKGGGGQDLEMSADSFGAGGSDAQQSLQSFWPRVMEEIRNLTVKDFRVQELPLARIKKIMKLDEDVKMISAEAPVLFAKAAQIFITELTLRAWIHTEDNKRRTLQRNDIAMAITKFDQFDFLIDIVPRDDLKPPKRQEEVRQSVAPTEPVQYYFTLAQQPGTVQVQGQQQGQQVAAPAATTLQPGQIIIAQPQQGQSAPVTMQVGEGQQVQIVQAAPQGQNQTQGAQPAGQTMQVMQQIITNTGEIQQIPVQLNTGQLQYIRLAQPVSGTQVVQGQIQTLAANTQQITQTEVQQGQQQFNQFTDGQELTQPMFIQSTGQTTDGQVTAQVTTD
ncbi:hypothetical protein DNTS_008046 [Danionella cerebrum]|uniref:Nuclear transcription factor Y subunit gamma n=1 Tax=Danionella cerebrum TaxID=2873325 RepID=A0A553RGF1_9TELE|nr:hypothetical protein DNTS_008046 [Danionella translucida]